MITRRGRWRTCPGDADRLRHRLVACERNGTGGITPAPSSSADCVGSPSSRRRSAMTRSRSSSQVGNQIRTTCCHPITRARLAAAHRDRTPWSAAPTRPVEQDRDRPVVTVRGADGEVDPEARQPDVLADAEPSSAKSSARSRPGDDRSPGAPGSRGRHPPGRPSRAIVRYCLSSSRPRDGSSARCISSGSNEQNTSTSERARVTATFSRRSPPLRLSGPKFSGSRPRTPSVIVGAKPTEIITTSRSSPCTLSRLRTMSPCVALVGSSSARTGRRRTPRAVG